MLLSVTRGKPKLV